ncbi:suppressor of cytokine signaling 2-like [Salminus brasiliensis]|uniref:suppressor of cytokine signaling 2-like n=1 Tax=Salminus brasiliensis TaxID=930266 RepID=UPI003B834E7F
MGHTQCISRSAGTDQSLAQRGSCGLDAPGQLLPEPPGPPVLNGQEIVPNIQPEKAHTAIRLKDRELEPNRVASTEDAKRLQNAMTHLQESGWYWGSMTAAEAKQLLNEALDGAFLLRDSSNPGYLLTLSVKTSLGPTHLRIEYAGGQFGFDSMVMARPHLRQFKGAVDLVQYYALASQRQAALREPDTDPGVQDAAVTPGAAFQGASETTLQLKLTRPLHKAACSLQHLCRVVINQHSRNHRDLPLPERLKDFLLEYPFVL